MKNWYESRTIWTSLIVFVASLLVVFGGIDLDVSPDAGYVGVILAIVQALLRLITDKPVSLLSVAKTGK